MSKRTGLVAVVVVAALVVAAFVLWSTSDGERLDRDVDRLTGLSGVDGVEVDDQGVRSVTLSRNVTQVEVDAVIAAFEDIGTPTVSDSTRVDVGWLTTDAFDLDQTWESMVAAGALSRRGVPLQSRAVGGGVWIEAVLGTAEQNGGIDPTPTDGARTLLPLLESLQAAGVPEELDLVAAHREPDDLGLVSVTRSALDDLDATITSLREVAADDPAAAIVCESGGCTAG